MGHLLNQFHIAKLAPFLPLLNMEGMADAVTTIFNPIIVISSDKINYKGVIKKKYHETILYDEIIDETIHNCCCCCRNLADTIDTKCLVCIC